MTPRENVEAMLTGGTWERLPFDLPLTPPVREALLGHYDVTTLEDAVPLDFVSGQTEWPDRPGAWREAYASLGVALPDSARIGPEGHVHQAPDRSTLGTAWHLTEMLHPLAAIEDPACLGQLPFPDPRDDARYTWMPAFVADARKTGRVAVFSRECTLFEHAWYLRGMDNLLADLMEDEPFSLALLDHFTERSAAEGARAAAAGFDIIRLGDDIGMQDRLLMSPDCWREHLKPRLAHVIQTIRAHQTGPLWVFYHSDGDIRPVLDDLLTIGVDILNPVQPECMDVSAVFEAYGDRCAFWGMLGTQTTLPFGSPADVTRAVDALRAHAEAGIRLVAAPTHVLEPDVPTANIEALLEAVSRPRR